MGLIGVIGLSVVFLRWMIRIAVRAFLIGLVGVILIGALYYLISYTGLTL